MDKRNDVEDMSYISIQSSKDRLVQNVRLKGLRLNAGLLQYVNYRLYDRN